MDGTKEIIKLNIPAIDSYNKEIEGLYKFLKPKFVGVDLSASNAIGGSLSEILMDYVKMVTHIDLIFFNNMVDNLKKNIKEVDKLYADIGEIEALYAAASYRQLLRNTTGYYCSPQFCNEMVFEGEGLYHPLISEPVSNGIIVHKGVLLTGSNASGKSTFLKTIAINAVLAQTLYVCSAESLKLAHTDVFSSMSLRDSLENNESYYIVEIKSLKRILDYSNKNNNLLCFVDEVLRGTNTVERISASTEILKSLNKSNVLCFAATHDIELTYLLEEVYDNYHFKEEVIDNDVLFDYKLFSGRAETRNAIKLLRIIGYDDNIINEAEKRALDYVTNGVWNK